MEPHHRDEPAADPAGEGLGFRRGHCGNELTSPPRCAVVVGFEFCWPGPRWTHKQKGAAPPRMKGRGSGAAGAGRGVLPKRWSCLNQPGEIFARSGKERALGDGGRQPQKLGPPRKDWATASKLTPQT
jgi:hypothetical protein